MFITDKMHKVSLFLPREDITRFWNAVGRFGKLEPTELRRVSRLQKYLSFIDLGDISAKFREAASFLNIDLTAPMDDPAITPLSPDELENKADEIYQELTDARARLQKLREARRSLDRELDKLVVQEAHLRMLEPLDVDIGALLHLQRFCVLAGTLPEDNLDQLERSLGRFPHALLPYRNEKRRLQLLIICLNQNRDKIIKILDSALFRALELPEELKGEPKKVLQILAAHKEELLGQKQSLEDEFSAFESWRAAQRTQWGDFIKINSAVLATRERTGQTHSVAVATGWVPKKEVPRLQTLVRSEPKWVLESEEIPYEKAKDEDGMTVPSRLRNPAVFRPFEGLVRLYGVPRYGGFDPTVLFTLSFILMFGMMFGDLGHGFILFLSGLGLLFWPRLRDGFRRTGSVLIAVGASSMVFGTLYGSFFGYEKIIPAVWFRPFDDINRILIYAIAVGAAMIVVGILINIASLVIQRRYFESIFTRFGFIGLLFYLGLLLAMRSFMGGGLNLGVALLMFIPLIIMAFERPLSKLWYKGKLEEGEKESPLIRLIVVGVDIFETVIVYFSNSLSFIRLAAFALNHVALSLAIFQLGRILEQMIGGGGVFYILSIIGGNVLILVLEGGIVGIQTLRLEFYEFFSKFFEAEGTTFRPFRLEYRRR